MPRTRQRIQFSGDDCRYYAELERFDQNVGVICSHLKVRHVFDESAVRRAFGAMVELAYREAKNTLMARHEGHLPDDEFRRWVWNYNQLKEKLHKWRTATLGVKQAEHRENLRYTRT